MNKRSNKGCESQVKVRLYDFFYTKCSDQLQEMVTKRVKGPNQNSLEHRGCSQQNAMDTRM